MHSKLIAWFLALAALSGCDSLVATSYRGESRLSLEIRVENRVTKTKDSIVPALAHIASDVLRFREVEVQPGFPADFDMRVYETPPKALLVSLDPWVAPDALITQEYVAAVIEDRLEQPFDLRSKAAPLFPECWDGNCDIQPTQLGAPEGCKPTDLECIRRKSGCPNDDCTGSVPRFYLPEGVEDLLGFSAEYVVLYVASPLAPGSWPALKLGAPDGLDAGYHLAKMMAISDQQVSDAGTCLEQAGTEAVMQFNAEHDTAYELWALDCQRNKEFVCDGLDLPSGSTSRALAAAIAEAEVEQGCLEIAPLVVPVRKDDRELITVRMGEDPPRWLPSVPLQRSGVVD